MSRFFYHYIWALVFPASAVAAPIGGSSLSWKAEQYFSSNQTYYRDGAAKQTTSISIGVQQESKWTDALSGVAQLKSEYSPHEDWNYFNVYELYATAKPNSNWQFSAGRKLETFTEWEQTWRQGLFQSRYLENKLDPQAAGLVGGFMTVGGEKQSFTLALIAANVPDFGPHHTVQDNKFVSANPWFHPPAPKFEFKDVSNDIRYSVNQPQTNTVLDRRGVAAKFETRNGPLFNRFSYAYKPMPQLLFGFPSRGRFHPGADFMSVEINARVLYHTVYAWDSVAKAGPWTFSVSAAHERPDNDAGPEGWTAQQVTPAWIYSGFVSRPLETEGPNAARITAGYLNVIGGDAPDKGDFAGKETLFERRFQYREAYLLELSKPIRGLAKRPVLTGLRMLYDRFQAGGVVSAYSSVNLDQNWSADLRVDLLGLTANSSQIDDGFLSTYRANDRFSMGMSYVF